MKIKWNDEQSTRILSNIIVLITGIAFYFLIKNLSMIFGAIGSFVKMLSPFIIGFVIAYLLVRPINKLEVFLNKHLFKKSNKQTSANRALSIVIVFLLVLITFVLVMYSIIPQLIESVSTLARNADGYIRSINAMLDKIFTHFNIDSNFIYDILGSSQEMFKKLTQYIASSLPKFLDFSVSIGSGISNFFIGFIISIYMLSGKERFAAQIKKLLFALLPKKFVDETLSTFSYMHETFGKYLSGQILDSVILGIICFILMTLLGMDYALLISMIIMITNFIPFIGPIIGAVPSAFILLMVQPSRVLWFIIMIIVLQQLDGNILAPKIVGKTTGLSSFLVIFSILIGGDLFGVAGVLLAVPAFSVIYTFFKRYIENKLLKKGLPSKTNDYFNKAK